MIERGVVLARGLADRRPRPARGGLGGHADPGGGADRAHRDTARRGRAATARRDPAHHARQQDARRPSCSASIRARSRASSSASRRRQATIRPPRRTERALASARRRRPMKVLMLTREYPPHVYGGAGVVVDQLTRALARRMAVEVRCFGERGPAPGPIARAGLYARGSGWGPGPTGPATPPALETLSIDLAMARDPVDADVAHAHTWYADMAGLLIRMLHRIPLVVTLHSLEPLRPWKADQLGTGYLVSTWVEKTVVEAADRIIAVSEGMREDILRHFRVDPGARGGDPQRHRSRALSPHVPAATPWSGWGSASRTCSSWGASPSRRGSSISSRPRRRCPPRCRWSCAPRPPTRPRSRSACAGASSGQHQRPVDRRDAAGRRCDPALQPRRRLLLPVGVRALRHHQSGGDGLRDAGGGLGRGRHPRGRGGWRHRACSCRRASPDALAAALDGGARRPRARAGHGRRRASAGRGAVQLGQRGRAHGDPLRRGHRGVPTGGGR